MTISKLILSLSFRCHISMTTHVRWRENVLWVSPGILETTSNLIRLEVVSSFLFLLLLLFTDWTLIVFQNPSGPSRLYLGDDEGNIHIYIFHQPLTSLFNPSKKQAGTQRIYFPVSTARFLCVLYLFHYRDIGLPKRCMWRVFVNLWGLRRWVE